MTGNQQHLPTELAAMLGIEMNEEHAETLAESFDTRDDIIAELEKLPFPEAPDRNYWEPSEANDPNAGFLVRCDLGGDGPLSDVQYFTKPVR